MYKVWRFNIRNFETLKLVHPLDVGNKYNKRRKAILSPADKLLQSTKTSAQQKGLDHDITIEDIIIPEFCPVFGWPLSTDGNRRTGASVDRLDSSKGYIKGNTRVISMEANRLKNNGTIDQFEKILIYMRNNLLGVS